MGFGDRLTAWGEEKKGVKPMARLRAGVTRWKKKTLTQTDDARERSRFAPKIDIRSAQNRSQVFGDKPSLSIKELEKASRGQLCEPARLSAEVWG